MTTNSAIVWVFDSHTEAEASIKKLQGHNTAPSDPAPADAPKATS